MSVLLISLCIGAFIGTLVWNIYIVMQSVPKEDRSFLDKPPIGFALVWPVIQTGVYYFKPYFNYEACQSISGRLKRAGVEYKVSAEQFILARYISALLFALLACAICSLLSFSLALPVLLALIGGYFYPALWLKEATARRTRSIFRALPAYLDVITLAIESGSNLTGGITHAVNKSADSPLKMEFSRVLRDIRAGKTRALALREMSERTNSSSLASVLSSMILAEKAGSSLAPVLRSQAQKLRGSRFQQAEKLGMEAPVKLLGPLLLCIFPTTFLIIGFVILSKALQAGVVDWAPLVWAYTWPNG